MVFRFDMNDLNRVKNFKVGKMKKKTAAMGILTALILVGLYYYVALPAVNFQETGIWMVLIAVLGVLTAWAALRGMGQKTKLFSLFSALLVLVIVVFLGGMIIFQKICRQAESRK